MDALGHVNNAAYSTWMENARRAWWTELAGPFDRFPFLLVRTEIDFRRPVTWNDHLFLALQVTRLGNSSFDLAYRLALEDGGILVAEARTVLVMYDHDAGRTVPMDTALRARLQAYALP